MVSERYTRVAKLGEGTYGIVYKALDRLESTSEAPRYYALKRCLPHGEAEEGFPITTLREIKNLRACGSHPHILHLDRVAVSRSRGAFLVLEYCEHDMANLIDDFRQRYGKSPFSVSHVKTLAMQLLSAVSFIHERRILHRDLKVKNLLYHRGNLKVGDFGLSRTFPDEERHLTLDVATLWYKPIELLLGNEFYSTELDIWAVGCIIGEIAKGYPLMDGKTENEQIQMIFQYVGIPPDIKQYKRVQQGEVLLPTGRSKQLLMDDFDKFGIEGIAFLFELLHLEPEKRISAAGALNSKFFSTKPLPSTQEDMPKFRLPP